MSRTPAAYKVADRLRVPIEDHHDIDPAEAVDEYLGHIDAPPLVGLGRPRFLAYWCALGSQAPLRDDQQLMLSYQSPNTFLVDRSPLHEVQVSPDAAIAPERMLRLQLANTLDQHCVTLRYQGRRLSTFPSTSSLFLASESIRRRASSDGLSPGRDVPPAGSAHGPRRLWTHGPEIGLH
jgi:hypothetical protein